MTCTYEIEELENLEIEQKALVAKFEASLAFTELDAAETADLLETVKQNIEDAYYERIQAAQARVEPHLVSNSLRQSRIEMAAYQQSVL